MDKSTIEQIVSAALAAPSVDNCQPWLFTSADASVCLHLDKPRAVFFGDYNFNASYVTFGAVVENMTIAAKQECYNPTVIPFPDGPQGLIARLDFQPSSRKSHHLYPALPKRCTNRRPFSRTPLPTSATTAIQNTAREKGTDIVLFHDRVVIEAIASLAAKIDSIIFDHEELHANLFRWVRWNDREVAETRDGLPLKSLELRLPDQLFFRRLSSWPFQRLCNRFGVNRLIGLINSRLLVNAGALAAITVDGTQPGDYLNGGRFMERVWLTATAHGLSVQPFGGLPFLLTRYLQGGSAGFSKKQTKMLEEISGKLSEYLPLSAETGFIILFRLGFAPQPSCRTLRRPLQEVLAT